MSDTPGFKPKKSVALSGTAAGNTAICTVGKTGNDLHYRGYDILDIAEQCEFEEIAYLIVHEKLPTQAELDAYKAKLKSLRDIPQPVKTVLEQLPASTVLTGCGIQWMSCVPAVRRWAARCRKTPIIMSTARAKSSTG